MYCSNCGKTLNASLNYCNSCGTRVEGKALLVRNSSSPALGIGAVFIGIVGLICFVPLLQALLHSTLDTAAVIVILVAYLLTVFAMFAVLIGHVWKNSGDIRIKTNQSSEDFGGVDAFRCINTAQLTEPARPMSVTEHTTKTLDKVPLTDN